MSKLTIARLDDMIADDRAAYAEIFYDELLFDFMESVGSIKVPSSEPCNRLIFSLSGIDFQDLSAFVDYDRTEINLDTRTAQRTWCYHDIEEYLTIVYEADSQLYYVIAANSTAKVRTKKENLATLREIFANLEKLRCIYLRLQKNTELRDQLLQEQIQKEAWGK